MLLQDKLVVPVSFLSRFPSREVAARSPGVSRNRVSLGNSLKGVGYSLSGMSSHCRAPRRPCPNSLANFRLQAVSIDDLRKRSIHRRSLCPFFTGNAVLEGQPAS